MRFRIFSICYITLSISLLLYSYTQVDLNLTLSQWSVWQEIQTSFQHIGWFQRELSTVFYLAILFFLFLFYLISLRLVKNRNVELRGFWVLIGAVSVILVFSYNAFSYDLFNYMFDARIVTLHHQNPYMHKALDYPLDPWINFMRWTHRTYPYGPVWLGFTIPLSFIGSQFFLPTLFLFKSLMAASFLGAIYLIGKILEKISPNNMLLGMAFFAFNPLILIESLVSGHHDILMMAPSLFGIYILLDKKYVRSYLLLFLSIGIKFATIFLIPIYIFITSSQRCNKQIKWDKVFMGSVVLIAIAIIFSSLRTEMQPWYFIWVLPFVSLLPGKKLIAIVSVAFSFGLLLHYVPFLYTGNWNPPIPTIKFWLTTASLITGVGIWYIREKVI